MTKLQRIWLVAMWFGKKIWGCHQIYERSFSIGNYQLPICARCTGILLGYLLAISLLLFHIYIPIWLSFSFLFPLIIDGGLQFLFSIASNNARRVVTGTIFGFGIIHLIAQIIICITNL